MGNCFYSKEKNIQMLLYLLKANNIRKVIISPGSTNLYLAASLQSDDFFELYSCVDERSAAYMACGMAEETGEPVVLSCTMATSVRNYMPGMTEAYYKKLPILAIKGTEEGIVPGNIQRQALSRIPESEGEFYDIAVKSYFLHVPHNSLEEWENNLKLNEAIIALKGQERGPVLIEMMFEKNLEFTGTKLEQTRHIKYYEDEKDFPEMIKGKIGIFIGSYPSLKKTLLEVIDLFCLKYDAVVLCDCSSNYKGKYGVPYNLITAQENYKNEELRLDLLIHIGEVSASLIGNFSKVWRIDSSGKIKDTFQKLDSMFAVTEERFFEHYSKQENVTEQCSNYLTWRKIYDRINKKIDTVENEMPISNLWIAYHLHDKLLPDSSLYLAILNSLRCWNYFEVDSTISTHSNTGGFGIDGALSTLVGASLANPKKIIYGVTGDLAFFYDMNALGNRHIAGNIRLLLINNGLGFEFKNRKNDSQRIGLGDDANPYIAASEHFGNKSQNLVKNMVEDLGYMYISARSKEEFMSVEKYFLSEDMTQSVIFEVFTNDADEMKALNLITTLERDAVTVTKNAIKRIIGRE